MEIVIEQTLQKLSENYDEWNKRYETYLKEIWQNEGKSNKAFRKPLNLSLYSTVGTRNEKCYFLRFKGQNVGKITVSNSKEVKLNSLVAPGKFHELGDCPILKGHEAVEWHSEEAFNFRHYFKHKEESTKTKSPEHFIENRLLIEFRQRNGRIKQIRNIQPVLLHELFFQMPTPLKASDHVPKYSGKNGGGIDIISRIRTKEGHIRLCVMEVKDENEEKETQKNAMSQAIIYATFIAKLIEVQKDWLKFFSGHHRRSGKLSNSLDAKDIEVVTIMPIGGTETFDKKDLSVMGTDYVLHCRTLYYDKYKFENDNIFEFSGSLLEDIKL
ncbi:MAG: hypothetical protein J1F13_02455 [Prevotellaceae bacterium]|nr:hypothetical protein [Prevotellaceae bacterium]